MFLVDGVNSLDGINPVELLSDMQVGFKYIGCAESLFVLGMLHRFLYKRKMAM